MLKVVCAGPQESSKGDAVCWRPGFGQAGTKCIVKGNQFFAELLDRDLNQYDVTITPAVCSCEVSTSTIATAPATAFVGAGKIFDVPVGGGIHTANRPSATMKSKNHLSKTITTVADQDDH